MAKQGLKGDIGSYAHTTMDDAFWIVGTEPNTYPTARVEDTGKELVSLAANEATGVTNGKSAIAKYEEIDNSSDHHGGTMSFVCMNNFNVDSGGGGINLNTCGNVSIFASGGLANIIAPLQTTIASFIVSLVAKSAVVLSGKLLYVETEKTTFEKSVFFNKNTVVNGGMFVNGELFASHLTTPNQMNFTYGTFAGGPGKDLDCFTPVGTIIEGIAPVPIPVDVANGQIVPGTPISIMTILPLRIATAPPHKHAYETPAFSGMDEYSDFYEKACAVFKDDMVHAKPTMINDMTLEELGTEMIKMVTEMIGEYALKLVIG